MDDLLWTQRSWSGSSAYAESKLCDVLLAFAFARRWKDLKANALEPGWIATKMDGPDDAFGTGWGLGGADVGPRGDRIGRAWVINMGMGIGKHPQRYVRH